MKQLILTLIMILSQKAFSCSDLFQEKSIQDLISTSNALDIFFEDDNNFKEYTSSVDIKEQKRNNSQRLVPYDRSQNGGFMDVATGKIQVKIGGKNGVYEGSAQKISRCHIITSAHVLYGDSLAKLDNSNIQVSFQSGQSCESSKISKNNTFASVYFQMTNKTDYRIENKDRRFDSNTDLVILKLSDYKRSDSRFFKLNTNAINITSSGVRADCWGFPGYRRNEQFGDYKGAHYLWYQKDIRIFDYTNNDGFISNLAGAHGMSGGGCMLSGVRNSNPELMALVAGGYSFNNNDDASELVLNRENYDTKAGTRLSSFGKLAQRFKSQTGKSFEDLDKECD